MDRWKAEQGRGRQKRKIRRKKSKKKEDADAWKGRKVAKHCVFPMIWGSGGSKSRLAKAAGAEPAGQMRDEKLHAVVARSTFASQNVHKHIILGPLLEVQMSKKCTPLWHEARFQVKMYKTHHSRTTFGSWDVEKVHAVVARSTFPSQNVQNTPRSDHFWKLRCRKSARRCGTKHILKSKCTKHTTFGPLLEVAMSKKCTPLWCEAHFQVKMYKTLQCRTTFGSWDVEKCTPLWREAHLEVKMLKTPKGFGPLLEVQISKKCTPLWREAHFEVKMFKTLGVRTTFGGSDVASLHYTRLHYTTLHSTTLQDIALHYTPVHYITVHYTPVHSTTLNYTAPHYITLHYAPLHYTTLHHITLHYTTLHYTTLSSTTLHYLTLQYTTTTTTQLHSTTLHYTPLHSTTLNYTTLLLHYTTHLHHYIPPHSTTPHYITLHYITLNDTAPRIDR